MTRGRAARTRPTFLRYDLVLRMDNGCIRPCFDVTYRPLSAYLFSVCGPSFCLSVSFCLSLACAAQTHDEFLKRTPSPKIDSRKVNKSGAKFSKAPRMVKSGSLEDVVSKIAPGADGSNRPYRNHSYFVGMSDQRVSQPHLRQG